MTTTVEVDGRWLVPGNRWDLLPEHPAAEPRVSVVVPHYEQPAQLARVLAALAGQSLLPYEVVVADDGSCTLPQVPDGVQVVRQEDRGFRAAAARNLGAAAATGDVLAFLDADTVPEPGYLSALTARLAQCPDVLAVGRRRHRDASGELPEPAWLAEGLADNLLRADGRSFRFVLSAVLAVSRVLFDELGGFDERFVGYGGEDWDFAYRAWNNGAVLVHEPAAVAWHDGPDWAGREPDWAAKDRETARLAALIPEPLTRGAALPGALPDVLVDLPGYDPRAVHCLLRQTHRDLRVRCAEPGELHAGVVQVSPWSVDQQRRARVHVALSEPVLLAPEVVGAVVRLLVERDLGELQLTVGGAVVGVARSTRALGRARRWPAVDVVDACFGREEFAVATVPPRGDLAGFLAAG